MCAVVLTVAATLTMQVSAQTTRSNRITLSPSAASSVKLTGSVHPMTKKATDMGPASASMQLETLSLNIGPSAAQQTEINALLVALQNPKSAQYHKWLTQEEYGARFGLTDADLAKAKAWLAAKGFTVKSVAPSRNLITFSGTVGQVESAFQTQIHQYTLEGKTHYANATEIHLPSGLSGVAAHVGGLASFRPKPHLRPASAKPNFTSDLSGNHFLSPKDWATIYGVNAIYNLGVTGSGMHVGIVGQTYFPQSDIDSFRSAAGLSATKLNYVCISASHCTDTTGESVSDMGEADLDVEWSGGIAENATVDFVYSSAADTTQGVYEALVYAITTYKVSSAVVPVISMSYGSCESDMTGYSSYVSSMNTYFAQAGTQGQTIMNSSGDEGSVCTDKDVTSITSGSSMQVSWPASSPLITAVGGTEFDGDGTPASPETGANSYWSYSSTADIVSSALQYIPETSWNDTYYDQSQSSTSTLSSGGGGVSTMYSLPTWQWAPTTFSGTSMRFVPDVSFSASPEHDAYLVCTQVFSGSTISTDEGGSCTSGFRDSSSDLTAYGGTSCSSPSFAGLMTLLVQNYGMQGNINPTLYSLAGGTSYTNSLGIFNDITSGTNKQPCSTAMTNCASASTSTSITGYLTTGYASATGYDLVTGLGSINGYTLYENWNGGSTSSTSTTTKVSVGTASIALGSSTATETLSVTVSNSSGTPTGSVVFKVGSVTVGSTTLSGGKASVTVAPTTANGFTMGTDTASVSYTSDNTTNFSSSSGSNVIAVTAPAYTITPASTSITLSAGSSQTIAVNLASTTYADTTALTWASSNSSEVSASLSSSSSALTAGGSNSVNLTITAASTAAAKHSPRLPWTGGIIVCGALLAGIPLTLRRKRAAAVLLTAVAIMTMGFMMSCGGSGGSSSSSSSASYTITVTGTGGITGTVAVTVK
jgi:hypothetical protein